MIFNMQKLVNTPELTQMNDLMLFYKDQLAKGTMQKAYSSLMNFVQDLRNDLAKKYDDEYIIGSISRGYLDFTYFPIVPKKLKSLKVKFVIYLVHKDLSFGISLSGQNKQVRKQYREIFRGSDFDQYQIPDNIDDGFIVLNEILAENPDFGDLFLLTKQIEHKAWTFIEEITEILTVK